MSLSASRSEPLLHVDVGGGTTKIALIDRGLIVGVGAIAAGGRVLARDPDGAWTRVEESAILVAGELGIPPRPGSFQSEAARRTVALRLASIIVDFIVGGPLDSLASKLLLTEDFQRSVKPRAVTFSGGVAEYVFGREDAELGDIGKLLAEGLREEFGRRLDVPVIDPGIGIRATAIGASQFTVQVSGKTIYLPRPELLPLRNVPVVHLDLREATDTAAIVRDIRDALARFELRPESTLALAFSWTADPEYGKLMTLARAIAGAFPSRAGGRDRPLVLVIDGDVARTLGRLLGEETGFRRGLIALDGVALRELDFVDIGELVPGTGVVPLVIKSLLFSK